MVLVVGNRALPSVDGLVLAHENLLGNLIQKTEVVGHDDTSTGEGLEGVGQPASIVTMECWGLTLMASASESMVGISRPLVGSSSSNMLGPSIAS